MRPRTLWTGGVAAVLLVAISWLLMAQTQLQQNYDVRNYQFTRTNGAGASGDLGSAGAGKVISFTTCPKGLAVNGSVYISGGTGTAEAVTITATTCPISSGGAGTITVTTSNSHSGAWTAQSATAAIQETINVATNLGTRRAEVFIPAGVYDMYAAVTYSGGQLTLRGAGLESTAVVQQDPTASWFVFSPSGFSNEISSMQLFNPQKTAGWGVEAHNQFIFRAHKLYITGAGSGGVLSFNSSQVYIEDCEIRSVFDGGGVGIKVDGIGVGAAETWITRTIIVNHPPSMGETSIGINVKTGGGINILGVTQVGHGWGMVVDPGVGQEAHWGFVTNSNFDTNLNRGVQFTPQGGVIKGWVFANTWISSNTTDAFYADASGGGSIDGVALTAGSRAYNNGQQGAEFTGANIHDISLQDFRSCGNGTASVGVHAGVVFNGIDKFSVAGLTSGDCDNFGVTQSYGLYVLGSSDNYLLDSLFLSGNVVGGLLDEGTGLFRTVGSKLLTSTAQIFPTVASAASLTLPDGDQDTVVVTGTTTITTMQRAWWGRRVRLVFTNAAPGGVATGGGGNFAFARSVSVTTNNSIECEYGPGTGWYCK